MTAASKVRSLQKSPSRGNLVCRTRFLWREAAVVREDMGKSTWRTRRGMGPSTSTKMAEIMSGRASNQQGLVATCKDRACKGQPRRSEVGGLAHGSVGAMKEG